MGTIQNDVEKFNLYVEDLITQLAARGATSNKLLTKLFNAHQTVNDQPFVHYIKGKENTYDKGEAITPQQLMRVALQKCKTRINNRTWQSSTAEEDCIMALEAELVQLRCRTNTNSNNNRHGNNRNNNNTNNSNNNNNSNNQNNNNNNNNQRKRKKEQKPKPEWTKVKPTEAEKAAGSKKQVDNKWWWWCPKHNEWCRHKPEDCKGVNVPNANDNNAQPTAQTQAAATLIAPYSTEEAEDSK